jgi:hypothetical protein
MIKGAKVRNLAKPLTENIKITGFLQWIQFGKSAEFTTAAGELKLIFYCTQLHKSKISCGT